VYNPCKEHLKYTDPGCPVADAPLPSVPPDRPPDRSHDNAAWEIHFAVLAGRFVVGLQKHQTAG